MKKTVSLAVALAAALWLSPAGAQEDNWIVDGRTGCAIWNPNPSPEETVSWLGDCVDGKTSGKGLLTYTVKGEFHSRYEGDERGGKHHGFGIITFADGRRVETKWWNGRPVGEGVMILPGGRRIKLENGKPVEEQEKS